MIKGSLSLRLVLAAAIVLLAFLGLTGAALEKAFHEAAHKAMQERLQAHIYALLATFDIDPYGQVHMAEQLLDHRFSTAGSGLYGFVFMQGQPLWRSQSALALNIPAQQLTSGAQRFVFAHEKPGLWILYYGVTWETERGHPIPLVLAIAEDAASLTRQVADFRQTLWAWLGGSGLLLLLAQLLILRWSLTPLRSIAQEVEAIEAGRKRSLEGPYPRELGGLAINLNALLESERAHLERYRNTLADLAHSLKTPLAILKGLGQEEPLPEATQATLNEQVGRMQTLVDYQLQRAAVHGGHGALSPIAIRPVLERIQGGLTKVYAPKKVLCILDAPSETNCFIDEGDLYELAGNLMDNAYKWCHKKVAVTVTASLDKGHRHPHLDLSVEDDGPGIPASQRRKVLKRGIRADQATHGHGIGLAIVNELVRLHRGTLRYRPSRWGGTCWEVNLPGPG